MSSLKSPQKDPVAVVIEQLAKIPGLGKRSATRAIYHMLKHKDQILVPFLNQLSHISHNITECTECHNIAFDPLCTICVDPKRDKTSLCIVEKAQDIATIEKAQFYTGRYHVIGGLLSAFDGITPQDLTIDTLLKRINTYQVSEIIFALPATQDGRTTLHYICDKINDYDIKITMPAQGMPLGSDLEFIDQGTMATAFRSRINVI